MGGTVIDENKVIKCVEDIHKVHDLCLFVKA